MQVLTFLSLSLFFCKMETISLCLAELGELNEIVWVKQLARKELNKQQIIMLYSFESLFSPKPHADLG